MNASNTNRYRTTRDILVPKGTRVIFVGRMKQEVYRLAQALVHAGPDMIWEWQMDFDDALKLELIEKDRMFDRKVFFDEVRKTLFGGTLTQQQVDGLNFKLLVWEAHPLSEDLRHLAYPLATAKFKTASTMWPVEEIGKGKGKTYGKPHPTTGKTYYGRGDVQLTWYENYLNATRKLELTGADDLTLYPERMLEPSISAAVMYLGMWEGWFRRDGQGPHTLSRYFNEQIDDAYTAREIINGDKFIVPKWSGGVSIGKLIAGYHSNFLSALKASWHEPIVPEEPDQPPVTVGGHVDIALTTSDGATVSITLDGELVLAAKMV